MWEKEEKKGFKFINTLQLRRKGMEGVKESNGLRVAEKLPEEVGGTKNPNCFE